MIRLGICTALQNAQAISDMGYDYLEVSMTQVAGMSDAEFTEYLARAKQSPLVVEAMNGMIPADYPLCSDQGTGEGVQKYLLRAFGRAQQLDTKVVVFGSGGARRLPDGMTQAQGYAYIAKYLELAGDIAQAHGMRIAIEPLRADECNIINHVAQAQYLAGRVGHRAVGALADLYHMMAGGENSTVVRNGVIHCHIAERVNRAYPAKGDGSNDDYDEFFANLKKGGYEGRVSIEGNCKDFLTEAKAAYALLNTYR